MRIRKREHKDSFEQFYLKNVAQSEGCGCAEHVLRKACPINSGDSLGEIVSALKERFRSGFLRSIARGNFGERDR